MAAPNVKNIQYAKARLIKDPSTTAGDAPYGGTYLGLEREVECIITHRDYEITYTEYGGIPGRILEMPDQAEVTCEFRGQDADAIARVWGSAGTSGNVSAVAAYAEDARAFALLVQPLDVALDAFYLPRCVGMPLERVSQKMSRHQERTWRARFVALPDASGRIWVQDPLEDITL